MCDERSKGPLTKLVFRFSKTKKKVLSEAIKPRIAQLLEKSLSRIVKEFEKSRRTVQKQDEQCVVQNCSRSARKSEEEINEFDAERWILSEKTIAAKTIKKKQQHFYLQAESPEKTVSQIDSTTERAIKKSFNFFY